MRFAKTFAALLFLTALAPQASAATHYGTSATGDVDVWGLPNPCVPSTKAPLNCLVTTCTDDIYTVVVTLRLLDPRPGDAVALSVVDDLPGTHPFTPTLYPADVATYDDPVAQVAVGRGGCNQSTTVVVAGLLVQDEVRYELRS